MGYDVFITKAVNTIEMADNPIPYAEWMEVVASDSTLELSSTCWYERRREDGSLERLYDVLWLAHPDTPPLLWMDGAVQIKNPDKVTIEKMIEIAGRLDARVLGEEEEEYAVVDGALQAKEPDEDAIERIGEAAERKLKARSFAADDE
jgi:hypothetical protein